MSVTIPQVYAINVYVDCVHYWFDIHLDTRTAIGTGFGPPIVDSGDSGLALRDHRVAACKILQKILGDDWTVTPWMREGELL